MELSFQTLKQKDVVSVSDGKNLGRVCDVALSFPECNWLGITVPGSKGFKLTSRGETFIPVDRIIKVGEDAVLVRTQEKSDCKPSKTEKPHCSPCPSKGNCPPPKSRRTDEPSRDEPDRRDYGEYE